MKRFFLGLLLMINSVTVFADSNFKYCKDQSDYISQWTMTKENLSVNIYRRDKKNFIYYDFSFTQKPTYVGFQFNPSKKIDFNFVDKNRKYGLFIVGSNQYDKNVDVKNFYNFFLNNETYISHSLYGAMIDNIYEIPLDKKYIKDVKIYTHNIIFNTFISRFQPILEHNNIYGKQKIQFYVNLIHDPYIKTCSSFTSPVVEYDFGRKPFSKTWSDFFK